MGSKKNVFSLSGKTALIIGGGGLGKPIACAMLEQGANVIVADRNKHAADELIDIAMIHNVLYFGIQVDLLDEESVCRAVKEAYVKTGRIDILVNAAGVNKLKKAEEYDTETWNFVLDVNLTGVHMITREVGKKMIQQRYGRILSISSVKSLLGTEQDYIAYCASKGAVNMYTKQLACEWGKYGITVNAVAPTFTRTMINAEQLDDPEFYNALVARIPLGRICTTEDISNVAVFLCSDAAEFITGQILRIDGGLTARQ